MRVTRLGEGVDQSKKLRVDAIQRTVTVLHDYRTEMDQLGVERGRQVATSAVREAVNGAEFLRAASEATDLVTELLSGEEEGRLSFAGAVGELRPTSGVDVVIDIGGGSTELAIGMPLEGDHAGKVSVQVRVVSLELGCVRISERYLLHDPPLADEVTQARQAIGSRLAMAQDEVPVLSRLPAESRLIGLAGTVSTIAALQQGLREYDRDRIHHFDLRADVVNQWCDTLARETHRQRLRHPGMMEGRQDVILGGVLVLSESMARLGLENCLVSESDILDGLIASQR